MARAAPADDWCKGFLAGIFDAEGIFSGGVIRISNTDPAIIDWTTCCLPAARLPFVVEDTRTSERAEIRPDPRRPRAACASSTRPTRRSRASARSRAARSSRDAKLEVVSIEPLGMELPLYDITTGTGDFIANGVVSHNCFARPTHEYLDLNAGRDFERGDRRQGQRARGAAGRSWRGRRGSASTSRWARTPTRTSGSRARYKLMRGIWEAMRDFANPCSILTKSPLLLRDMDLLLEIAERDERQRVPVGADARREGVAGDGAAHAAPARAARGGGGAQPDRDPDGHPDRAADARDQRRARAGGARSWRCAEEAGATSIGGQRAVPARRDARRLLRLAARPRGPTWWSATSSCTARARTCRTGASAASSRRGCRGGGARIGP